jgi:hypothetical protein
VVGGVGQGKLTPPPTPTPKHWDHGKNPKNPFKLLTNILNIYKYYLDNLKQGPQVQIYIFGGPNMAIKMGFGHFLGA